MFEIVGTSEIWFLHEEMSGTCHRCSGDGDLATTDRAAYYPDEYKHELRACPSCGGCGVNRSVQRQT